MISIRRERPEDTAAIRAVNEAAFAQGAEADIVDALRDTCPDILSVVAESDGEIVGHMLFSPVTIEGGRSRQGMGLAPMAVMPNGQRRGIGSRMVQPGLAILREQGCPFIIVLGHPEFYPRFGFVPASRHGLRCQWEGVPAAAFMVLVLDEATMAGVIGVARYGDEFPAAMSDRGIQKNLYFWNMWTWSLNWGEITPRILVGTCPMTTADLERIGAEAGVSAVLSVQHDHCLAYWDIDYAEMRTHGENLGLRMARSPMRDFDIPDQRRNLAQAVRALAALQSKGHRTSGVGCCFQQYVITKF